MAHKRRILHAPDLGSLDKLGPCGTKVMDPRGLSFGPQWTRLTSITTNSLHPWLGPGKRGHILGPT